MAKARPNKETLHNAAVLRWIHDLAAQGILMTDDELNILGWNQWLEEHTERRAAGYEDLPVSLGEALTAMQGSELVAETLGEHVFEFFLRNKWEEFNSYRQNVTPFELRRYLPGL